MKTAFNDWITARFRDYGFTEGVDFALVATQEKVAKGGDQGPPRQDEQGCNDGHYTFSRWSAGNPNCSGAEQLPGPLGLALCRKQIHEARHIRDAVAAV